MSHAAAPLGMLALVADAWSRLPDDVVDAVVPSPRTPVQAPCPRTIRPDRRDDGAGRPPGWETGPRA